MIVSVLVFIGLVKLFRFFDNVNKKNNFENIPEYRENKKLFDKLVTELNLESIIRIKMIMLHNLKKK